MEAENWKRKQDVAGVRFQADMLPFLKSFSEELGKEISATEKWLDAAQKASHFEIFKKSERGAVLKEPPDKLSEVRLEFLSQTERLIAAADRWTERYDALAGIAEAAGAAVNGSGREFLIKERYFTCELQEPPLEQEKDLRGSVRKFLWFVKQFAVEDNGRRLEDEFISDNKAHWWLERMRNIYDDVKGDAESEEKAVNEMRKEYPEAFKPSGVEKAKKRA